MQGTALSSRRSLRTDHFTAGRRQATCSKYPNQALKIVCTSMVMSIAWTFGFHRSEAGWWERLLDQISTSGSPLKREENVPFP